MNVPQFDLKPQYAGIKEEVLSAVAEVLESQVCIGGPKVAEFEQRIAALCGCEYAVGVSSGTDALLNCLMSLEIGSGDEVITTPFTFFATVGSIVRAGAKPVFADIDPRTFNIDPSVIERYVTPRTKAIMPVHLFGQACDMDPILDIAARHGLYVIEDAAQAIAATYKERRVGSMGTAGCFSFFPSKNLGGAGDGGMVVTNDRALYERMAIMRLHGAHPRYFHTYVGGNFRLDAIQAAVLLVKLPHLSAWSEARRRHAAYYDERFSGTAVRTPYIAPECVSVYNQYVIRVDNRDELRRHLDSKQIGTDIYYPLPLHLQRCFQSLGYREGDLPESERASREVLALPLYPEMTREMLDFVCDSVLERAAEWSRVAGSA